MADDTLPWAVRKWLNRLRCRLGCGRGCVQVSMCYIGCTFAPPDEYDWTVRVRRRCGLFVKFLWPLVMVALCNRADHYIYFFLLHEASCVTDIVVVWPTIEICNVSLGALLCQFCGATCRTPLHRIALTIISLQSTCKFADKFFISDVWLNLFNCLLYFHQPEIHM